jgi:nicotinamidase/pyrazinamidase
MSKIWTAADNVALIIVDPQNDFCPGGALAVDGGDQIMPLINSLRENFSKVYISQDSHPKGHISYASTHSVAPFTTKDVDYGTQMMWPDHCGENTQGEAFHKDLIVMPSDKIIKKGTNVNIDSYSAFLENDKKTTPIFTNGNGLAEELEDDGVDTIIVVGLALDYCAGDTALDGLAQKFNVLVVEDATRSITQEGRLAKIAQIVDNGGIVLNSKALQNWPQLKAA